MKPVVRAQKILSPLHSEAAQSLDGYDISTAVSAFANSHRHNAAYRAIGKIKYRTA